MENGEKISNTLLRIDGKDPIAKIIYELKPYNRVNLRKGVKQIVNYKKYFDGSYKMVIVFY